MKIRNIISACFAGSGIYLMLTGSMAVIFTISILRGAFDDASTVHLMIFQFLALCMPFITGVFFLFFASRFSALVCRFSQIKDEAFTTVISARIALTIACVITGLTLGIQKIPEFAKFAAQQFLVTANPEHSVAHQGQDLRILLIEPGLYSIISIILLLKAGALARWLALRYENGAEPAATDNAV